eukprot:CAMPEP_0172407932 /NCGR_PEP_ID=MMETSP1061-20121228/75591_1 /TAXON_ID=37318 /ORGANISM="Pseudo-nitzschia pungens, Strain cf. pungens" /LENGTH=408 /DNA_ID=CAMNT_0013144047 /DNA_START=1449 /DNA_END=2675 /DNA_ORIENTATION=-
MNQNTGVSAFRAVSFLLCLAPVFLLLQICKLHEFRHGNPGWNRFDDDYNDSSQKVMDAIQRAAEKPIIVAKMTDHFFSPGDFQGPQDCKDFDDIPLTCIFEEKESLGEEGTNSADVHWYHAPHFESRDLAKTKKAHPSQLRCVVSMESSANYPQLDDPVYMKQFDIESSYGRSSDIPMYDFNLYKVSVESLRKEPLPLSEKRDAIAYVQTNCNTKNRRQEIMQAIVDLGIVTVNGLGLCGKQLKGASTNPLSDAILGGRYDKDHDSSKIEVFRSHKFCIAIENSNVQDYVTEKIWQPLMAGCVPIYYGSPDIKDIIPDPNAILHYPDFDNDPEKLSREIDRLINDDDAYLEKLAWKKKPLEQWSPSFQAYVKEVAVETHQCRLCRMAMEERIRTVLSTVRYDQINLPM